MKFTKMHGLGNDYVYVNGFEEKVNNKSEVAIKVSDRHFGIGSDGIIFINPSKVADFEMEMYNADGSRAEMCGNGIRCVAKYVYDHKMIDKECFTIETLGGIKVMNLTAKDGKAVEIKVDMGAPVLTAEDIPVDISKTGCAYTGKDQTVIKQEIKVDGCSYEMTAVSMGNPHTVVPIDVPVKEFPLEKIGPLFENHPAFPKRVNTEFIRVLDRKTVEMRVWERGSGETLACGTGACAVAVSCILNGYTDNEVTVKLLGGDLKISWAGQADDHVYMTGPATTVYDGEISL